MQNIPHLFSNSEGIATSFGRGESLADVQAFADAHNCSLIRMQQVHSAEVKVVTDKKSQLIENTDALITKERGVLLAIKVADCLPILFSHPSGVVGVIHAGRVGTERGITRNVLQTLQSEFAIQDNLTLWFGPCICEGCYQIDRDSDTHYDLVTENTKQVQATFSDSQAKMIVSEHCTAHHNSDWYSYRTEGKGVGRNWCAIGLQE